MGDPPHPAGGGRPGCRGMGEGLGEMLQCNRPIRSCEGERTDRARGLINDYEQAETFRDRRGSCNRRATSPCWECARFRAPAPAVLAC